MANHCYRLQSCKPTEYDDISNLCTKIVLLDNNKTVYINGDQSKLYRLIYIGEDACICKGVLPPYSISEKECGIAIQGQYFLAENCKSGEVKEYEILGIVVNIGNIVEVVESEDCWRIIDTLEKQPTDQLTATLIIAKCKDCGQSINKYFTVKNCKTGETKEVELTGLISGIIGETIKVAQNTDCWTVLDVAGGGTETYTVTEVLADCKECEAGDKYFYDLINCKDSTAVSVELLGTYSITGIIGKVIRVAENTDCWTVQKKGTSGIVNTLTAIIQDCSECDPVIKTYFRIKNCVTAVERNTEILGVVGAIVGKVVEFALGQKGECWEVMEVVNNGIGVSSIVGIHNDCVSCLPVPELGTCTAEDGERTIAYAVMVRLPEPSVPDKGFKECCYENLVLADENDSDPYRNDFNGFFFKKQTAGDDCEFILHELSTGDTFALNNSIYGTYKAFNTIEGQNELTTYIVEWRKVLALLGTGLYQIEKSVTVAGITINLMSNMFILDRFSTQRADTTIRIDTKMDGKMVDLGINFKNSGFKTSVRTDGFFGRRNPKYKQDNLVKRNYKVEQISMSLENEYQMQSGLIPECISEEIYDFILFGNEIFISDYNLINHSYKYRVKPVELSTNKGAKYYTTNRDVRINLTFKDRKRSDRKINC